MLSPGQLILVLNAQGLDQIVVALTLLCSCTTLCKSRAVASSTPRVGSDRTIARWRQRSVHFDLKSHPRIGAPLRVRARSGHVSSSTGICGARELDGLRVSCGEDSRFEWRVLPHGSELGAFDHRSGHGDAGRILNPSPRTATASSRAVAPHRVYGVQRSQGNTVPRLDLNSGLRWSSLAPSEPAEAVRPCRLRFLSS
jgi:hypothetical protein